MTTTAFDDQFTAAPVHERYDVVTILRRNVAALELALKQQTERAEAAEAELLAVRDDNHSMMLEIDGMRTERDALAAELAKLREQKPVLYMAFSECGQFIRYWTRDTKNLDATIAVNDFTVLEFFASPVPAPAVPAEWREVMSKLVGIVESSAKFHGCGDVTKQARALLQSVEVRMIDDKLLATYESRVDIRNARRYLALRGRGLLLCPDEGWIGDAELDAAADRLLERAE